MSKKLPITHVLAILDRSGSMHSLTEAVREGYNNYLADIATDNARYRITTVLFSDQYTQLCVAAKLKDAPRLDEDNHKIFGMTALVDAVGKTITNFEKKTTVKKDERVIVFIHTDGQENFSQKFTSKKVAEMVRKREKTGKWMFIYMGAGIDAWDQGGRLGSQSNYRTSHDRAGTAQTYHGTRVATGKFSDRSNTRGDVEVAVAATGLEMEDTHDDDADK